MLSSYPTTQEIIAFAKAKNVSRRMVRFCKDCRSLYVAGKKHECNRPRLILRYSSDVKYRFYSVKGETTDRFFGLEWEVRGQKNPWLARRISKLHRCEFRCELDGSVDLEFISQPMTLNYIKKNFDALFVKALEIFKNKEMYTDDTCGAHIHVSRAAFLNYGVVNLLKFFQNKDNWSSLLWVSGRKSLHNHYCDYDNIPRAESQIWGGHDRYSPINFNNKQTIEFRLWTGTLDLNRLMANFMFTDRLVTYCHSEKFVPDFDAFIEWMPSEIRTFIHREYSLDVFAIKKEM